MDGYRSNNHIDNLIAVSIQEHYDIHHSQGEYGSCLLIADRMGLVPEEKSRLASLAAKERVKNGTHHWLSEEYRVSQKKNAKIFNKKNVKNGTHPWISGNRSEHIGKHLKEKSACPFCGTQANPVNLQRWHGTNCKVKNGEKVSRSTFYRRKKSAASC